MNRLQADVSPVFRLGLVALAFLATAFVAWSAIGPSGWWTTFSALTESGLLGFVLGLIGFVLGVVVVLGAAGAAAWIGDQMAFGRTYTHLLGLAVAAVFFGVMAQGIGATEAWKESNFGDAEDMDELAQALFTDHVIALEVLGILLTAAMIGAMVIARPLGGRPDAANYPTKRSRDQLDAIQSISDIERNLGAGGFAVDAAIPDIIEQAGVDAWPEEKIVPPPAPQAKAAPAPPADSEDEESEAPAKKADKGGSEE